MDDFMQHIERHRSEFFRYVLRTVWDSGVAEDVFASAVLAAWENRHKFQPGTNFRAWMYRILTNKCFVANRITKRTPQPLDETPEGAFIALGQQRGYAGVLEDPSGFIEACGDEVHRAFALLSAMERSCILLRSAEGFSYKDLAEILDIPVGTVMTHLSRGRAKLRRELLGYAKQQGIVRGTPRLLKKDEGNDGARAQGSTI